MDDIIKYDVRTYVQELIKKEFSSKNNEENVLSNNCKTNPGEHRNVQRRPLLHSSVMEERFQTWENKYEC